MSKFLYIHLNHLQIRTNRVMQQQYLSFLWHDCFYFSNVYSSNLIDNFSVVLNYSLLLPIPEEQSLLKSLMLQVWQNHMILFEHEVDLSQLNTRNGTRKKLQIIQGQILQFSIHLLQNKEVLTSTTPNHALLQHFLVISSIKTEEGGPDSGPSYFKVQFSQGEVNVPVINSIAMIPIPTKLRFCHIKNGKPLSYSKFYQTEEIHQSQLRVQMIVKEDSGYDLDVKVEWMTNLWRNRTQTSALLEAHDILLSDIQIRFETKDNLKIDIRPEQLSGIKLKVAAGNKVYELNGDIDPLKNTRFARIIYFIVKSQEEDFSFILQKGSKLVAKTTVGIDQLLSYHPNTIKRKLVDPHSGRIVATVKCRGEKAKNLSLPQNNGFWKSCSQNRIQALMLEFSQISLWEVREPCGIIIKSQEDEIFIPDIPDFSVFKLETELPPPVSLTIKQDSSIYLKLVPSQPNRADFVGMAVINPKDLRLGSVPITVPFYKQKEYICEARLIVNKVMPWPFVKGINHPDSLAMSGVKLMSLSVMLKSIELTSYYWSYLYDRKGDLYCIVELNRVKKVLILQKLATTQKLLFLSATGSDLLNFLVDHQQSFKVKFTFLASDEGVDEEIYGTTQKRIKIQDISEGPKAFQKVPIANSYSLQVGELDFQIQKGLIGQYKRAPVKKQLNLVKQDLDKINKSIEKVEKKIGSPHPRQSKGKAKNESLILPEIKDPKQERLKRLAKALQAQQKRQRKPNALLTSIQTEQQKYGQRKNRVKSQGLNGINQGNREELENLVEPLPVLVREEVQSEREKQSERKSEIPLREFQENEFVEGEIKIQEREANEIQEALENRGE